MKVIIFREKLGLNLLIILSCFILGLGLYYISFKSWWYTTIPNSWIALSILIFMLPPVAESVFKIRKFLNFKVRENVSLTTLIVALLSSSYLYFSALINGRKFYLQWHDEFSYALQSTMLAHGKLWMPTHPLGDAFESFHILIEPVYASVYFLGTAMFNFPGVILHLPHWIIPLLISGCVSAFLFRIILKFADPTSGILGSLILISIPLFEKMSIMLLSVMPVTLLILAIYLTWLKWEEDKKLRWVFLLGTVMGWAAITRPLDALTTAMPVGLILIWKLRKLDFRFSLKVVALAIFGAVPFFALQAFFNYGVTGNVLNTPYQEYLIRSQPGIEIGFHSKEVLTLPNTRIPQKLKYYSEWMRKEIEKHQIANLWELLFSRVRETISGDLPSRFLLIFLPFAFFRPGDSRLLVLWAMIPIFFFGYFFNTFYLTHYTLALVPIFVAAAIIGQKRFLDCTSTRPEFKKSFSSGLLGANLFIFFWMTPIFHPIPEEEATEYKLQRYVNEELPLQVRSPALVFFRYGLASNYHEEPVYNSDALWPDEADIIRIHARDRDGNKSAIDYYASIQPDRNVYVYDRDSEILSYLGSVLDLARHGGSQEIPTWNSIK